MIKINKPHWKVGDLMGIDGEQIEITNIALVQIGQTPVVYEVRFYTKDGEDGCIGPLVLSENVS
jgi:hypothetical protein